MFLTASITTTAATVLLIKFTLGALVGMTTAPVAKALPTKFNHV